MTGAPLSIGIVTGAVSHLAGGLFNSVRRSAQTLADAGCDVTVYGLRDRETEADLAAWGPLEPLVFEPAGPAQLGYSPQLNRALGDHDVLHQHGIWQGFSIGVNRWRQRTGRPVMISARGMLDPWAANNSRWKKKIAYSLFESSNLHGAACLHALAMSEEQAFRKFGLRNPVARIPNGVDAPPSPTVSQSASRGLQGRRTLLFIGRLHPKKGLVPLLEAWGIATRRDPGLAEAWELQIAGWDDGGHLAALERANAELPAQARAAFLGPLHGEAKQHVLKTADAFILPSFSEGLPMSVLEAWAAGLAVFMTPECNLTDAFEHDAAIRISNDPARLAAELEAGLRNPDLAKFGARGQAFCMERFTWPSIAERHIATYRWMLGDAERPRWVSI